jgi:hypothetical protein
MRIRIVTEGRSARATALPSLPQNCLRKLSRTARPAAVFTRAS